MYRVRVDVLTYQFRVSLKFQVMPNTLCSDNISVALLKGRSHDQTLMVGVLTPWAELGENTDKTNITL